jgi:hypothetical protein
VGNLLACFFVKSSTGACVEFEEADPCAPPPTDPGALVFTGDSLTTWYAAESGGWDARLLNIWQTATTDETYVTIDDAQLLAGASALVYDFAPDLFDVVPGQGEWGTGNADVAVFYVCELAAPLATITAPGIVPYQGFTLAQFTAGNDNILFYLHNNRVKIGYARDIFSPLTGVFDVGPAADLTGAPVQLILRVTCTGSTIRGRLYVDEPCLGGTPTLYGDTGDLASDEDDISTVRYFMQQAALPAGAILKLWQLAVTANPSDFGL